MPSRDNIEYKQRTDKYELDIEEGERFDVWNLGVRHHITDDDEGEGEGGTTFGEFIMNHARDLERVLNAPVIDLSNWNVDRVRNTYLIQDAFSMNPISNWDLRGIDWIAHERFDAWLANRNDYHLILRYPHYFPMHQLIETYVEEQRELESKSVEQGPITYPDHIKDDWNINRGEVIYQHSRRFMAWMLIWTL